MNEQPQVPPSPQSPPVSPQPVSHPSAGDDAIATLIPYRNGSALASYYVGLFSIFPFFGAVMGIVAVVLGVKGLKVARENPQAKGKAHAIVGIVCGVLFGGFWILATIGIALAIAANA